jgi:nucleoside-diphosphate-sugar epimerase
MSEQRKILLFGASGLIGRFVTDDLRARGFHVVGVASGFIALFISYDAESGILRGQRRDQRSC